MNRTQFLHCDGGIVNGHDETGQSLDESKINFERFCLTRLTGSEGRMVSHSPQTLAFESTYSCRIPESKNSMLADT